MRFFFELFLLSILIMGVYAVFNYLFLSKNKNKTIKKEKK